MPPTLFGDGHEAKGLTSEGVAWVPCLEEIVRRFVGGDVVSVACLWAPGPKCGERLRMADARASAWACASVTGRKTQRVRGRLTPAHLIASALRKSERVEVSEKCASIGVRSLGLGWVRQP